MGLSQNNMTKIKTLIFFLSLIALIHNSFLIRISIAIAGTPGLIPYGLVTLLTIVEIIFFFYSDKQLSKNSFLRVIIILTVYLLGEFSVVFSRADITFINTIFVTFPFLFFFLLIIPVKTIDMDKLFFKQLLFIYMSGNLALGLAQGVVNKTFVQTEYFQEPFVNPIFIKDGFSTAYSYLLDYGGKVRSFGLFDSGLTLGLFLIFCMGIVLMNNQKKGLGKYVSLLLILSVIYLTRTRNVYIVFSWFIFIFIFRKLIAKIGFMKIFITELSLLIIVTFSYTEIFNAEFFSNFDGVDFSSLISRRNLFIEALSGFNGLPDYLFGIGKLNIQTIDNDILYIVNYGGLMTLILILAIYLYSFFYCIFKKEKQAIDRVFLLFMLTYPVAASINYVSSVYLVVCTFYLVFSKIGDYRENEKTQKKDNGILTLPK